MALYFVTGSLGGGKSLAAMSKIDEYLRRGRKIATNMNLNLEFLCSPDNNYSRVMRLPDAPSLQDLKVLGMGADKSGEKNHGLLVLDELGTWFNSRDFADKGRKDVIKFCIHLRKRRWDVLFLVQDFAMVDKQMRGNITQYLVTCQQSHDFWFFRILPKFHIGTVRLKSKIKTGTWFYRGKDLYQAYDTEQLYYTAAGGVGFTLAVDGQLIFKSFVELDDDDQLFVDDELKEKELHDMELNGLYSLLPPAYLGNETRQRIRDRHKTNYKGRGQFVALVALVVFNLMLWPDAMNAIAPPATASVVQGETEQGLTAVDPPAEPAVDFEVATFADLYGPLRVQGYARFGRRIRYTFQHPDYEATVTDEDLAAAGVKLKPEGPDQVTLIFDNDEQLTLYR